MSAWDQRYCGLQQENSGFTGHVSMFIVDETSEWNFKQKMKFLLSLIMQRSLKEYLVILPWRSFFKHFLLWDDIRLPAVPLHCHHVTCISGWDTTIDMVRHYYNQETGPEQSRAANAEACASRQNVPDKGCCMKLKNDYKEVNRKNKGIVFGMQC